LSPASKTTIEPLEAIRFEKQSKDDGEYCMRFISWKPSNYTFALTAVLALIAAIAPSIYAQNNYGTVRGRVTDDSGAVIPDASVILTNDGTEIARTTRTNPAGDYFFTAVEPGNYTVLISAANFKKTEHTGIVVELEQTATVDEKLAVGTTGETVQVTGTEPLIDTATASGGVVISEDLVENLPNIGRNPFTVSKLETNVTPTADPKMVRLEDQNGTDSQSVSGSPIGANVFVVDGIPISTSTGGVTFVPALEAVSAVKVQANTYDAEPGRTGGGVFNTSLKSGEDKYHGVLFGTTRQNALTANQWINDHNGIPKPDYTTYQYAGAIGGKVPFTDKYRFLKNTFLWATEEGYRQAQPLVSANSNLYLPTVEERKGDFSLDTGFTIYDPTQPFTGGKRTVPVSAPLNGVLTNNVIPSALINPIGQFIANLFPLPTVANQNYDGTTPNFIGSADFKTRGDEYVGKLDHEFAPWWLASASYVHLATQEPHGNVYHTPNASDAILTRYIDATAIHNTFTITPTTQLTVGYGYSRYYSTSPQYSNNFNQETGFGGVGFPAAYVDQLQSKTFPTITLSGVTNAGTLGSANTGPTIQAQHSFVTTLTKTIGKHNLKAGYVFRDFHKFVASVSGGNGSFTFNGQYTDASGAAQSNGPQAIADLLLGLPSSANVTINAAAIDQFLHYQAFFVQDDARISNKLTANVGLRYEYEPGQAESKNQYNVGFDPTISYDFPGASGDVAAKGAIVFAGLNGYPKQSGDLSQAKFSPRIGLSYEVRPGTVVRAGFGVFYAGIPLSSASTGFSQTTSYSPGNITSALSGGATGTNAWISNPFDSTLLQPSGTSLGNLTGVGQSITVPAFHLYYPLVQQYSADVEKQLPDNIVLKIGYVGAHARNIQLPVNINQLSNSVLASYAPGGANAGTNLSTKVTNPYYAASVSGYPTTGVVAQKKVALAQTLLPFPQFGSISVNESVGHSRYNAFDVKVQKRFSHGLTALVAYTWASNWDNLYGAQVAGLNQTNPNPATPQDNYNPEGEYSRATNDTPNRLTFAVSYELPVGRGKPFLGHANRIFDAVVGGWKINDVTTLQNGGALPVIQTDLSSGTFGTTGVGGSSHRPNLVAGVNPCYSGSPQSRLGGGGGAKPYFNLSEFTPALPYTYGNAPRTLACKGPGYSNSDLAINKNFRIRGRLNFEFRAEALNAFNKPEFSQPNNTLTFDSKNYPLTLTSATFTDPTTNATTGAITSQLGFSRIIQVGGRLSF
jgi:hypothetical protein